MSEKEDVDLVQVKFKASAKSPELIVFIPSSLSQSSLCRCLGKVVQRPVSRAALNGIALERTQVVLRDGDIIEPAAAATTATTAAPASATSSTSEGEGDVNMSAFQKILRQEGLRPRSMPDLVALYIHYLLLQHQWSCIVEEAGGASAVKG